MNAQQKKNMAASIKQRLLNLAKERGEDFNFILSRFTVERFLYRISSSDEQGNFIVKGAMLFHLRALDLPYRPTHDLDLLGSGPPDIERMVNIFRTICRAEVPDDGLIFQGDTVQGEQIKAEDEYLGIRLRLQAMMGTARIPLQIDVGFGDAVTPAPQREELATLLDLPSPAMLTYPWESVVAEKFHAIVELGMDNSRMKDYFDLHYLSETQTFDGKLLANSIQDAFARRKTDLPEDTPTGLLSVFGEDSVKQTQWQAFIRKNHLMERELQLNVIIDRLGHFLLPPVKALANKDSFQKTWSPGGPWEGMGEVISC